MCWSLPLNMGEIPWPLSIQRTENFRIWNRVWSMGYCKMPGLPIQVWKGRNHVCITWADSFSMLIWALKNFPGFIDNSIYNHYELDPDICNVHQLLNQHRLNWLFLAEGLSDWVAGLSPFGKADGAGETESTSSKSEDGGDEKEDISEFYSYDRLKASSTDPAPKINLKRREVRGFEEILVEESSLIRLPEEE